MHVNSCSPARLLVQNKSTKWSRDSTIEVVLSPNSRIRSATWFPSLNLSVCKTRHSDEISSSNIDIGSDADSCLDINVESLLTQPWRNRAAAVQSLEGLGQAGNFH